MSPPGNGVDCHRTWEAIALGASGPILRSTGVAWDLRRDMPYLKYDEVDFDVIVGSYGDAFDRFAIRLNEIRESMRIVRQILDRLRQVRKIGISPDVAGRIHADRFRQYVREGRASPAYMIERYIPSRRRATLVAFLLDLEERLTDSALEMADKLIGGIFTRAKNA